MRACRLEGLGGEGSVECGPGTGLAPALQLWFRPGEAVGAPVQSPLKLSDLSPSHLAHNGNEQLAACSHIWPADVLLGVVMI